MTPVEEVRRLFQDRGSSRYGAEAVSQLQHALQSAFLASRARATEATVCAALLHDLGHLLHTFPDDAPGQGVDDRHECLAFQWLVPRFRQEVVEPVRLHVAAKRYLCATDPSYLDLLSVPSRLSLLLQGGRMEEDECREFEREPYYREAILLRHCDDGAKDPKAEVPPFSRYEEMLERMQLGPAVDGER